VEVAHGLLELCIVSTPTVEDVHDPFDAEPLVPRAEFFGQFVVRLIDFCENKRGVAAEVGRQKFFDEDEPTEASRLMVGAKNAGFSYVGVSNRASMGSLEHR
jgi:hypothetical protein